MKKKVYLGAKELSELKKSKTAISNISVIKELKVIGFKVVPSIPTPDQVAKINRFTRREFKAEELYVGQLRLSNNCIDRDNERFSEEVIQRFTATTLRRTMLLDHDKQVQNAIGKFFDVELEKMPLQQAVSEIGEELTLPDGITEVWFHSPWFYVPREGVDPEDIIKIDAGIYDFASIGFRAESLVPVLDKDGDIRFWEYRGSGKRTEMTEGSLVYLGAQYGMSVKSYGDEDEIKTNKGGKGMTELMKKLAKIFPGKNFTEENLGDEIESSVAETGNAAAEKARQEAEESLQKQIEELKPLAEDGKAYRDGLITRYVAGKAKLGEASEKAEDQENLKKIMAGYPIDFLKTEVDFIEKRVAEKFPDESQTKKKENEDRDRSDKGNEEENKLKPKEV